MIRNGLKKRTPACLLAATLVLSACGGLTRSDKPADTVWWLQPVTGMTQADAAQTPLPIDLSVSVVPGLDSDRILTLSGDAELKPYAGARWAENLPELVSSLIGRSLQASGRFEVSQQRSASSRAGCDLQLELREFFARLGSGGHTTVVSVELDGRYQCGSDAPRSLRSRASVEVAAEQMNVIVASFQHALDDVTVDILKQIQ